MTVTKKSSLIIRDDIVFLKLDEKEKNPKYAHHFRFSKSGALILVSHSRHSHTQKTIFD